VAALLQQRNDWHRGVAGCAEPGDGGDAGAALLLAFTNSAYQPKAQRATVTGKLVINDALRPGSSAAGAWVGLAAPDSGIENDPNDWQFQSDAYQYWTQAAADGSFTIPDVQTFSPYGGAASI
jgi:hypothetical protein